ncbi:MAG: hypothetical protein ACJ786_05305 [Catenulispora sp.]
MSSTSAVAVLAQGLRDLRDYAEGPDGEDLRERTGLSAEQVDAALGGEQLPSREVTLALVAAWEGDVEAWRAYWAQIAELVKSESASGGKKKGAPTPPEPSIITPIRAQETSDTDTDTDTDTADEAAKERAAAIPGAVVGGETTAVSDQDGVASTPEAAGDGAAGAVIAEQDNAASSSAASVGALTSDAGRAEAAEAGRAEASRDAAQTPSADAEAGPAPLASGTARQPAATEPAASAVAAPPRKKSALARVGIPVLLFAVGVGVGAFGDHALSSKSPSNPQSAALPTVSQSHSTSPAGPSRSTQTASLAATAAATNSSSSPSISDSSESSDSSSSTASPGAPLGAYSNIQLASGYSVDFFNDTYHPVPGTANGPDTMGFLASSFVDGRFYADRVAILDPQDTGTFAACRNNTRYQHDVLLSQVSAGSSFCVHTTTGHLVLVTVRRMPSSTDANPYAVLDMTVWQDS